jgi:hypothetical protein
LGSVLEMTAKHEWHRSKMEILTRAFQALIFGMHLVYMCAISLPNLLRDW